MELIPRAPRPGFIGTAAVAVLGAAAGAGAAIVSQDCYESGGWFSFTAGDGGIPDVLATITFTKAFRSNTVAVTLFPRNDPAVADDVCACLAVDWTTTDRTAIVIKLLRMTPFRSGVTYAVGYVNRGI